VIAGACMYAPYGPFFAIVPEILPANVAGGAMALINSMGALGSFGGSYLVGYLNGATGSPGASYLLMSGALLLSVVLTLHSSLPSVWPGKARWRASGREPWETCNEKASRAVQTPVRADGTPASALR
jgi:MFS family permease